MQGTIKLRSANVRGSAEASRLKLRITYCMIECIVSTGEKSSVVTCDVYKLTECDCTLDVQRSDSIIVV